MAFRVFMSHTHKDARLAEALRTLLTTTFEDKLEVQFSSDDTAGGGIPPGTDWREWIRVQAQSCDIAVIILTEQSLSRPWLMWEAGAVSGVALVAEKKPPIVPLLYRVKNEDVPSPLTNLEVANGESADGITRLLSTTRNTIGSPGPRQLELIMTSTVGEYLKAVGEALEARPQALTEGDVQEWCERLDELRQLRLFSQVGHVHRALQQAFGTLDAQTGPVPLDVRLHRRLGQLYLDAGKGPEAVAEFALALKLSKRDLYLMHKLALAQLESGDVGQAERTLVQDITGLAVDADVVNPEIAGLKGRIYRERWRRTRDERDLRIARDAYRDGFEASPDSYYLAVNAGELSFALGENEAARANYAEAEAVLRDAREHNVWTNATLAAAGLVRGLDNADILRLLENARQAASAREIDSIWQGLERLHPYLGLPREDLDAWRTALGFPSTSR